jgi:hypothetical protein
MCIKKILRTQVRSFRNNLANSWHTVGTRSIWVPIVKPSHSGSSSGSSDSAVGDLDHTHYDFFKASWQHIAQAYVYMKSVEQSAKGAYKLSFAAVYLNNRSKMSEGLCNALLTSRTPALILQAHEGTRHAAISSDLPRMTDPTGTVALLHDLILMNDAFLENKFLYTTETDARLVKLQALLARWERMQALIGQHFKVAPVELKKFFFTQENMRELQCSVSSFQGYLQQFRSHGKTLNGGKALPLGTGLRMPSQNRYAYINNNY